MVVAPVTLWKRIIQVRHTSREKADKRISVGDAKPPNVLASCSFLLGGEGKMHSHLVKKTVDVSIRGHYNNMFFTSRQYTVGPV